MIRVNLVPQEFLDRELQKQRLVQVSAAASVAAVFFLAVSASHYYTGVKLVRRQVEAEAEFKRLEAIVKQVEELEASAKAVRARLDVIQDLLTARPFYPRFMTRLLEALGEGVYLTSLAISGNPAELIVNLNCTASSPEAATAWLRSLSQSAFFKDPAMGGLSLKDDGTVTFSMGLKYRPEAAKK